MAASSDGNFTSWQPVGKYNTRQTHLQSETKAASSDESSFPGRSLSNMQISRLIAAVLIGAATAAPTSDETTDSLSQFQALANNASATEADMLDEQAASSSKRTNTCTRDKLYVRKPWYVIHSTSYILSCLLLLGTQLHVNAWLTLSQGLSEQEGPEGVYRCCPVSAEPACKDPNFPRPWC